MVASRAFLFRPGVFEFGAIRWHDICSWLVTPPVRRRTWLDAAHLRRHVAAFVYPTILFCTSSSEHNLVLLHGAAIHALDLQAGRRDLAWNALSTRRIKKRFGLATQKSLFRWDHFAGPVFSGALGFSVAPV